MALIRYEDNNSVQEALTYEEIICCGIPLIIREAYSPTNKCKCIICDIDLQNEYKKLQSSIFEGIKQLHKLDIDSVDKQKLKAVKKELKDTSKRLYKQIKQAIHK